ncbi:MAG: ORF6N domain-containing protein [Sulfurimonadaceae bacterium]
MFQLTKNELEILRSQIVTTKFTMTRTTPYVFTEHGISMLSSVLKSQLAIEVNIQIMRTFSKIREFTLNYKDIITRIEKIEKTLKTDQQHQNYNSHRIDEAFELLHQILQDTQKTNNNLIGFRPR